MPGEELYNLDFRDEDWWVRQALLKKYRRELASLQDMARSFAGGNFLNDRQAELVRNIELLLPEETEERKRQQYADSWAWLKDKNRG